LKTFLESIIEKSGLDFLRRIEFEQVTPGRYFQKEKTDIGNGCKMFFVVLGPNVESPVHNHAGQNMEETHLLLYGSGKFILYVDKNRPLKKFVLEEGKFHKPFSTKSETPDHQYVAGSRGSITLAIESYF
jgi:hypothetical protein